MSNSLVRTSLELFGYENSKSDAKRKRRNGSKRTLDLLPKQHRLVTKKNKKGLSTSRVKLSIEEAKKQLNLQTDPTEENVRRLLLLGGQKLESDTAEKLVNRALDKRCARPKTKKPEKEEGTVFTEEDFAKFEAEYDEL